MGNASQKMFSKIFGDIGLQAVMAGLDGVGKTTILYKLNLGEVVTSVPAFHFYVETVEFRNTKITNMEVGFQKLYPLERHLIKQANSLIYVIDSQDRERLDDNKLFLNKFYDDEELKTMPVLIFANKQDLPYAIDLPKLTEQLELYKLKDRKWKVQPCCATTLKGVYEGLNWLSFAIKSQTEENKNQKEKEKEKEKKKKMKKKMKKKIKNKKLFL